MYKLKTTLPLSGYILHMSNEEKEALEKALYRAGYSARSKKDVSGIAWYKYSGGTGNYWYIKGRSAETKREFNDIFTKDTQDILIFN